MENITNNVTIRKLDYQEAQERGYYQCPYVWEYQNYGEVVLGAGESDSIMFVSKADFIILLCNNHKMGYVGMEVYNKNDMTVVLDVFIQTANELHEGLLDMDWKEQIDYLMECYRE